MSGSQKAQLAQRGEDFQDRKLNSCAICHTRKQIAVQVSDDGSLYFLCRSHALINEMLRRSYEGAIARLNASR